MTPSGQSQQELQIQSLYRRGDAENIQRTLLKEKRKNSFNKSDKFTEISETFDVAFFFIIQCLRLDETLRFGALKY